MKESSHQLSTLASSAGFGVAGRFGGRLLVFLYGVLAARFLGPEIFGLYAIGLLMFRLLEVILPLGFDVGIIKYGVGTVDQHPAHLKGILGYSFGGAIGFSILLGLGLYLIAPWFSGKVLENDSLATVIRIIAFSLPLAGTLTLCSAGITILRGIRPAIIIQDIGQPLLAVILLIAYHTYGAGLNGALLSHVASYGIAAFIALISLYRILPRFADSSVDTIRPDRDFYLFSMASMSTVFLSTMMLWTDRLLLAYFVEPYEVGIYQAASQLAVVFAVLMSGLNRIFIPIFAELRNQGEFHGLRDAYRIGTKWAVGLGLPVVIFLGINAEKTIQVLLGDVYGSGASVLLILLVGQLVNLFTGPIGPLLTIGGYHHQAVGFSGIALVLNISGGILLIPRFGILGAAWTASFATGFLYLTLFLVAVRNLQVAPFDKGYLKLIIATATAIALGMILKPLWNSGLTGLAVQFGLVIAVFFTVMWMQGFEPEDQALLAAFKNPLLRMFIRGKWKNEA